jgi:hypothetical protein
MSPSTILILLIIAAYAVGFGYGYFVCWLLYKRGLDRFIGKLEEAQKQKRIDDLYGRSND